MKIKIALISSEYASKAQDLSTNLQNAMEAGEMSTVDQLTEELISLAEQEYSLSLTEEYWQQLIKKVRASDDNFKSDYIMAKPQLETIIAASVAESFSDVLGVVEQALKIDGVILQLPIEEEDIDV
jgi:adenosyl cobinamide kinase/adenosyl cobinamide phosphate guanylyltransferase